MNIRRKILLSLAGLAMLLVLAVGAFAGAAVYFRMEREAWGNREHWAETRAVSYAEQGNAWEALVTVHRVPRRMRDLQTGAVWRVLRILVRDGYEEVVLRYQQNHRFDKKNPQKEGIAREVDVKLAVAQAELGRTDDANETIRRMEKRRDRLKAMRDIALLLAIMGEREKALSMARRIPSPYSRARALSSIALLLAGDDEPALARALADEALANALRIGKDNLREDAVRWSAETFATLGYHDEAIALAETLKEEWLQEVTLEYIVQSLAEAGKIARAREIALLIGEGSEREYALRNIIHSQLALGDAAGAMQTAGLMPAELERAEMIFSATLGHRIDFQFSDWNFAIANTLLELADMMARTKYPDLLRYCLLGDSLAAGNIVYASRAGLNIEDKSFRPTFLEMAEHLLYGRRFCRAIPETFPGRAGRRLDIGWSSIAAGTTGRLHHADDSGAG